MRIFTSLFGHLNCYPREQRSREESALPAVFGPRTKGYGNTRARDNVHKVLLRHLDGSNRTPDEPLASP